MDDSNCMGSGSRLFRFLAGTLATTYLLWATPSQAATFVIGAGDEAGLIDAVNAANATPQPDTIELTPSTYTFYGPSDLTDGPNALPSIVSDIHVKGNGATLRRSFLAGSLRLLHVGATGTLTIDDLTVLNGRSLPVVLLGETDSVGGAIFSLGQLIIRGSQFTNNLAVAGGAVFSRDSYIQIESTTFTTNRTSEDGGSGGGALKVIYSSGTVAGSTFFQNSARLNGGAINLHLSSDVTFAIEDCVFEQNRTEGSLGGAIHSWLASDLTINSSRFLQNTAYRAGAISSVEGNAIIRNSTFQGNSNGAISASNVGQMLVDRSTFVANLGNQEPLSPRVAGIRVSHGHQATILNSTFSGSVGGAVQVSDHPTTPGNPQPSTVNLVNSTLTGGSGFVDHYGASYAGGVTVADGGTLNLVNTIVANSTQGLDCLNLGTIQTNESNLIEDGSCGPMLTGDPILGTLASNGGPTRTHALKIGSAAINSADLGFCPPTDQRGAARPVGSGCDIGSFEAPLQLKRIRVEYLTKPKPFMVLCDPLLPETLLVDLLGDERFDPQTILAETVSLGGAPPGSGQVISSRDVNGDGLSDLSMQWQLDDAYRGLDCQVTQSLRLKGHTDAGKDFYADIEVSVTRR